MRTTMESIVNHLRQAGMAASDDEFDGVTYWSDDQLLPFADRNGTRGIVKAKRVDPSGFVYRLNVPPSVRFEDTLEVYSGETAVATDFTFNHDTNELTFDTALYEDVYNVYAFVVQMYDALAELWQVKADQRFNYIDWKAQNNKMNMKQEYDHCVNRATFYRAKRIRTFDRKGRGKWYV